MGWKTKEAERAYMKKYREKNKDKLRATARERGEYRRAYYQKHRSKQLAQTVARKRTPKGRMESWSHRLLTRFGMTIIQYEMMNDAQGGKCLICDRENTAGRRLAVDHCHVTGRVRGLLCTRCNRGIGLLGDRADLLARAVQYLGASNG